LLILPCSHCHMLPWNKITYFVCCFIFSLFYSLYVWASQEIYIKCIFPRLMNNKIFIQEFCILCHYHSGLGARQSQVALMNHSLVKLYNLIDSQPIWPSSSVYSLGNHQTGQVHISLGSLLFPDLCNRCAFSWVSVDRKLFNGSYFWSVGFSL
jgi:hypothetical protein